MTNFLSGGVAALLTLMLMGSPGARGDALITVDPSIQYGAWEGWGTSLAWWAKVVGGFPEPARSDYMTKAFDPAKGLGLNIVRYNIGGGENPAYQAPNPVLLSFRAAVPGYAPSPGVWNWAADANQRRVLSAAMKLGANQVEAFSNSPPWWATVSGSVTGGKGGADNLRPGAEAAFADYLTRVVQHFHDIWGITFRDMEPLNEPAAPWWTFGGGGNRQEGCHVAPDHQNVVVKVIASFARPGMSDTPVTASDETAVSAADDTFGHYDREALAGLSKINTHTYGGGDRTQLFDFAAAAGKDLWMSEYGDGDASGLQMSRQILMDVKGLHPSAWVYWQFVDGGGWGMLTNPESDEVTTAYGVNQKYYVMGQYSRFIRPGSVLIACDDPNSLSAYDPRTKAVIIVATNSADAPMTAAYDLSKFTALGGSAAVTRTASTERWAALPPVMLSGKCLCVTLPPKSVTSYVIRGAAYAGPQGFGYREFYRLVSGRPGIVLGVAGASKGTAAAVAQADAGRPDQQWDFVGLGHGLYQIVNRASGLVLDVDNARTTPGAGVLQYSYGGGKNQIWRPVPAKKGGWALLNWNSGLALDASAGGVVTQEAADGGAGQTWRLIHAAPKNQMQK